MWSCLLASFECQFCLVTAMVEAREKRKEKGNLQMSREILKESDIYNYYTTILVTAGLWGRIYCKKCLCLVLLLL